MTHYRLTLEYLGTRYRGWQAQKNAETVANQVERAARGVFTTVHELYGSGRTDAGVHALAQVAHLKADRPKNPRANLKLALNDLLPPDIAVLEIRETSADFHARYQAKERVYLYQILRRRSAFGADLCWWVKDPLNVKKMQDAAALLIGKHDFGSFCDQDGEKASDTRMDLRGIEIKEDGALILLRFRADRYLWKQVRRMTGFLAEVGRGRYKPEQALALLSKPSRELAPYTAPPSGLFLEKVLYTGERFGAALNPVVFIA